MWASSLAKASLCEEQCRLFRKYPFNFGPGQLNSISKDGYLVLIQLLVLTVHLETTHIFQARALPRNLGTNNPSNNYTFSASGSSVE
jgi:hypothetical protein